MSRFASGISAPHSTPITRLFSKPRASRAPMVNPYDKFTQPEFDAWIGDMTDTLRRALGYEQEEQLANSPEKTHLNGDTNGHIPDYRPVDLSDGGEDPDDSFAQIKSRRAKGKARDPREGPGLGRGDRVQPIEIVSSDEEEEEEVEGLALSVQDDVETEEEEDEEDEEEEEEEEDEDYAEQLWDRGQSSSQILSSPVAMKFGPPKRSRFTVEAEYEQAGSEEGNEEKLDHIEEMEFDKNTEYARESDLPKQNGADEVIAISDDDEDVVSFGRQSYEVRASLRDTAFRDVDEGVEGRERDGSLDIEEVQPLDDDSSFPPTHSPSQRPEIRDPWEGLRRYAADFYSGGDVRVLPGSRADPDHLGPFDDALVGESANKERIVLQGERRISDDASLPPHSTFLESHIHSPYPLQGSEIHSEGLDDRDEEVGTPPSFQLDPSLLQEDEGSGIDSFLTPGALTPDVHSRLDEDEDGFEEQQAEEEHATPHGISTLPPPPTQGAPISDDPEIIAVDDSDDEQDNQTPKKQIDQNSEPNAPPDERSNFQEMEYDLEVIPPAGSVTKRDFQPFLHKESTYLEIEEIDVFNPDHAIPDVPVVEDVASPFDEDVGVDEEILSVHTAQTDDMESENHLQPTEVIEMETPLATAGHFHWTVSAERESPPVVEGSRVFEDPDNVDDIYSTPVPEAPNQTRLGEQALDAMEPAVVTLPSGTEDIDPEVVEVQPTLVASQHITQLISDHLADTESFERIPTPPWDKGNFMVSAEVPESLLLASSGKEDERTQMDVTGFDVEAEVVQDAAEVSLDDQTQDTFRAANKDESVNVGVNVKEPSTKESLFEGSRSSLDTEGLAAGRSATPEGLREAVFTMNQPLNLEAGITFRSEREQRLSEEEKSAGQRAAFTLPLKVLTVPGHPQLPMPIRADANVPDPTESPTTPCRRQRNFILSQQGTPNFVITPGDTPRSAGEAVPVSVSIPHSVLRALGQGNMEFLSPSPTPLRRNLPSQTDGLFTPAEPAEPSMTSTSIVSVRDLPKQALQIPDEGEEMISVVMEHGSESSPPEGEMPPNDIEPILNADDIVELDRNHLELLENHSQRAPEAKADAILESDQSRLEAVQEDKPIEANLNLSGGEIFDVPLSENGELVQGSQLHGVLPDTTPLRKSPDPILCADPYPYSLSTPGAALQVDGSSSEVIVMENSLSSNSTSEKDNEMDGGVKEVGNSPESELQLQYPPQAESSTQLEYADLAETSPGGRFVVDQAPVNPDITNAPPGTEESFKSIESIGSDPGGDTDRLQSSSQNVASEEVQPSRTVTLPSVIEEQPENILETSEDKPVEQASQGSGRVSPDNSTGHTQKRKREASPGPGKAVKSTRKPKGRRKGKAGAKRMESPTEQPPERDIVYVRPKHITKVLASKNQSSKGSDLGSLPAQSRSSAASSAPNDNASAMDTSDSPVSNKAAVQSQLQYTPPAESVPQPIPFFHAHGRKRKNLNQPMPLVHQPQQERQVSRKPSSQPSDQMNSPTSPAPIPELSAAILPDVTPTSLPDSTVPTMESPQSLQGLTADTLTSIPEETLTGSPPQGEHLPSTTPIDEVPPEQSTESLANNVAMPPPPARQPASNAPITRSTRSQCKYHRISLPKEEAGPRVYFLIPGCSLTNEELMVEEEIEDHGEATYEDSLRAVGDIESLYLDQQVIGVLRQLVGLDILREGEVYYLPQLGEWLPRKQVARTSISEKSAKIRVSAVGDYGSSYAGSPTSARSLSTKPPLSNADSTSTSLSVFRKLFDSERGSIYQTTDSEPELDAEEAEQPSASAPQTTSRGRPRGSLAKDVSYHPDEQDESPDEQSTQKKRGKLAKRGVKRARTMDIGAGEEGQRKSKRLKKSMTAPVALTPVKDSSTA